MANKIPKVKIKMPRAYLERESEKAYGFRIEEREELVWIPLSQIEDWEDGFDSYTFWVPVWLMKEKELDYFQDTSHEPSLFDLSMM